MSMMHLSLPDSLKTYLDERVRQGGYGGPGEYLLELIRKDQECKEQQRLRGLLLSPAGTAHRVPHDISYFEALRERFLRAASSSPSREGGDPHGV